jgi:hypothetical protein
VGSRAVTLLLYTNGGNHEYRYRRCRCSWGNMFWQVVEAYLFALGRSRTRCAQVVHLGVYGVLQFA